MARPLSRRPYLGLDLVMHPEPKGLQVVGLTDDSPLTGSVHPGCWLRALDGSPLGDVGDVRERLRQLRAGDRCELRFDEHTVTCTLSALPAESVQGARVELGEINCGDYHLRSLYTFPEGGGPFPLVWLLPGSQMATAECVHADGHPTLSMLAALSRRGYATLRVERSGVGDSEGPHCALTDLNAELHWWRQAHSQALDHPAVRPGHWFLFGRSLGGIVLQLLAAELQPRAAAVWGTSSQPWHDVMWRAAVRQKQLAGLTGRALDVYEEQRRILGEAIYIRGERPSVLLQREPELLPAARGEFEGDLAHDRDASFFQQLQATDVAAHCSRFGGPLLVMRGEMDWLADAEDAQSVIEAARDPTAQNFAGIDHLMQRQPSLQVAYRNLFGGVFDESGCEAIADFFDRA